jgi:hypothetical protein
LLSPFDVEKAKCLLPTISQPFDGGVAWMLTPTWQVEFGDPSSLSIRSALT